MSKFVARLGVIALLMILAGGANVDPVAAKTADVDDATTPYGGTHGGRWYSYGTVTQSDWAFTYEWVTVFFPWPPHYELRMVKKEVRTFYLREVCSYDPRIWECTPGTERLTAQYSQTMG